jgi:hypothetical protein
MTEGTPIHYTPPVRRRVRGKGHSYQDANGLKVPSVTTITKCLPKDAIIGWAGRETAKAAVDRWEELSALPPVERYDILQKARWEATDKAANRGTQVHKLGAKLVLGEKVDVPEFLQDYVAAYVRWLDTWQIEPVLVETSVMSHRHGVAGTLDLLGDIPHLGMERWLIDLKTSRTGVYGETALQLAGYRYADTYYDEHEDCEKPMLQVDGCAVAWVQPTGVSFVPVEAGPAQYRYFLYLKQVYEFLQDCRDLVGETLDDPPAETTVRLVREMKGTP